MDNQHEHSDGALLSSIVIITLILVGGVYLAKNKAQEIRQRQNDMANNISNNDELNTIEADLKNNSNISDLDKDLQ